jgi:hypothetical protein
VIVELRRAGIGTARHLNRFFQHAAVFQVGRDPELLKTMIADGGRGGGAAPHSDRRPQR